MLERIADTWTALPDYAHSTAWILVITVSLIICVALLTLWERKVIGWMQLRRGPNRVRIFGLLPGLGQPFADVFKLLMKEVIIPAKANKVLFRLAPMITLIPAFAAWAVIPLSPTVVVSHADAGLLYLLSLTSMGVYGVIIAGWATNSKYAFLGAMRSAAQMVAYEIAMGFALVGVLMATGSMNLGTIVRTQEGGVLAWNWFWLFPLFVVYFISGVAETNRAPFDVAEGESEIVAGFHVEYSGIAFALFFLAEYANMILISALAAVLFLGGWQGPFAGYPLLGRDVPRRAELPVAVPQGVRAGVPVPVVPRHLPALPLRPDHAPGLEGADPGDARMDRGRDGAGGVSHRTVGAALVSLKERPMAQNPLKTLLLPELLKGLMVTARTLVSHKTTLNYPEEKTPQSARFRGLHALRRYANGQERCIACKLCEAVCPAVCITIDSDVAPDGTRRTTRYDIDLFKCIYCGFCEEACPVDAIVLTRIHEYHMEKRGENIMSKDKLLAVGDRYEAMIATDKASDAPYR